MLAARMTRPNAVDVGEEAPFRNSAGSATKTSEARVSRVMLPSLEYGKCL